MDKFLLNISELVNYLASDFRHFQDFYKNILKNLKKEAAKKPSFLAATAIDQIEGKINHKFWKENKDKKLFGVPFTVKDLFLTKKLPTKASSKILANFISPTDATIIRLAEESGAILVGKTILDEFAAGGTGLHAAEGEIFNPYNKKRIIGGSSSGAPWSLFTRIATFAMGTDTGDSVRVPASFSGYYGFKPSFGAISRYGLISFAPSFDTVGVFTANPNNFRLLFSTFFQFDKLDSASQKIAFSDSVEKKSFSKKKIGYFVVNEELLPKNLLIEYQKMIQNLKSTGMKLKPILVPEEITKTLTLIYQIINFPFLTSSLSNQTGIHFGKGDNLLKEDYVAKTIKTRTENFGPELKKRMLFGSFFLEKENYHYFYQAHQYRRYVIDYCNNLFRKYDFLLHPATVQPPLVADVKKGLENPKFAFSSVEWLLFANFGGFPSYVLPYKWVKDLPFAINVFADIHHDYSLVDFGLQLAKIFQFPVKLQNN